MTIYAQLAVPPKEWPKQAKVHRKRVGKDENCNDIGHNFAAPKERR